MWSAQKSLCGKRAVQEKKKVPKNLKDTHYEAESLSWYSLERLKQA